MPNRKACHGGVVYVTLRRTEVGAGSDGLSAEGQTKPVSSINQTGLFSGRFGEESASSSLGCWQHLASRECKPEVPILLAAVGQGLLTTLAAQLVLTRGSSVLESAVVHGFFLCREHL